jgi:hypothetical protein
VVFFSSLSFSFVGGGIGGSRNTGIAASSELVETQCTRWC